MSKIVNNFFKKVNKENKIRMTISKDVISETFNLSVGNISAPVVIILNKLTADITTMFPSTGEIWRGNMYEISKELKTTSSDSFIESELKRYLYKEILKRYRFMFDAKSIEHVHLNYDRTF